MYSVSLRTHLLQWNMVVKKLATLGANWRFTMRMLGNFAKKSQGVQCNQVHSELWLRSHSFRPKANTQPRKYNIDSPFIPKGYKGWKFHRSLHCPRCFFKHQCPSSPLSGVLPTPVKVERLAYYLEGYNENLWGTTFMFFCKAFVQIFMDHKLATFPLSFFLQHSIQKLLKVN